jgi:5'-3' exonuclease
MDIHLVDGTYELFRHFFVVPSRKAQDGQEAGAVRAVLASMLGMLEDGATHVGIATDHVVESFRNDLYEGYKDGSGLDPDIASQFGPLERVLESAGFRVFAMTEHEADDALGSAARIAAADARVRQVLICTPDKDLGQCVTADGRIVQLDRRKQAVIDEAAVVAKFGVPPAAIPDYLGLVGDSADGFPGLPGWGAKSTATVLARYGRIEDVPASHEDWDVKVRGAAKLAATLRDGMDDALLFRRIATVAYDAPTIDSVDELAWKGPRADLAESADWLRWPDLVERVQRLL